MINAKIGLEIEGITLRSFYSELQTICGANVLNYTRNFLTLTDDGSIRHTDAYCSFEIRTKPVDINDESVLFDEVETVYNLMECNSSCGLHIHISFKDIADYYKILSWDFVDKFQKEITKTFKTKSEKARLQNQYCEFYKDKEHFKSITQVQLKASHKYARYYAINYNAFNLHRTIEFRIFPATNKISKLKKYIGLLKKVIEQHLNESSTDNIKTEHIAKIQSRINFDKPLIVKETITQDELKTFENPLNNTVAV